MLTQPLNLPQQLLNDFLPAIAMSHLLPVLFEHLLVTLWETSNQGREGDGEGARGGTNPWQDWLDTWNQIQILMTSGNFLL